MVIFFDAPQYVVKNDEFFCENRIIDRTQYGKSLDFKGFSHFYFLPYMEMG